MEDMIHTKFHERGLIGRYFRSGLEILPLPETPTTTELRIEDLAEIRPHAYRRPQDFPAVTFLQYFNKFYIEGQRDPCIHFIVWLPAQLREFVLSYPFNNM
jgi:hypothetical protein